MMIIQLVLILLLEINVVIPVKVSYFIISKYKFRPSLLKILIILKEYQDFKCFDYNLNCKKYKNHCNDNKFKLNEVPLNHICARTCGNCESINFNIT